MNESESRISLDSQKVIRAKNKKITALQYKLDTADLSPEEFKAIEIRIAKIEKSVRDLVNLPQIPRKPHLTQAYNMQVEITTDKDGYRRYKNPDKSDWNEPRLRKVIEFIKLAEERLNKVLKNTDPIRKSKAKQIESKLSTVLKFNTQAGTRFHFKVRTESQSGEVAHYNVDFRTPVGYGITEDNWKTIGRGNISIFANCDCPDFKYRWETVLHRRNSARRITSNGNFPDIMNPTGKLSTCKHILSAWPIVKEYIAKKDFNKLKSRR